MKSSLSSLLSFAFLSSIPAQGADYYLSGSGNDANSGNSVGSAFATIGRLNSVDLDPGDRVFLEGGSTFSGTITIDDNDRGATGNSVLFNSYGSGRAIINSGNANGLDANSAGNVTIENLEFRGSGAYSNSAFGVRWQANDWGDPTSARENIALRNLKVSGYNKGGILVEAVGAGGLSADPNGWDGVQIVGNHVHDNADYGIATWGPKSWTNTDFYVAGNKVHDNYGLRNHWTHTGSGIKVAGITGGLVEYNTAFRNGRYNGEAGIPNGPVGIWAFESSRLVMQYNESFANETQTGDGGGFDFDGAITNSIMQYNYSHDNAGSGYLVSQYESASTVWDNVIIANNITENDNQTHDHGAIAVWGHGPSDTYGDRGVNDLYIYNNTIVLDADKTNGPAVRISGRHQEDLEIFNNALILKNNADHSTTMVRHDSSVFNRNDPDNIFENNAWEYEFTSAAYPGDGSGDVIDNTLITAGWGWEVNSPDDWERVDGNGQEEAGAVIAGANPDAIATDLGYASVGDGVTINDESSLEDVSTVMAELLGYDLAASSVLINAGIDPNTIVDGADAAILEAVLLEAYGLRPSDLSIGDRSQTASLFNGGSDFFGNERLVDGSYDIGAIEWQIPEPSSALLLGLTGLVMLCGSRRRS